MSNLAFIFEKENDIIAGRQQINILSYLLPK